MARSCPWQVPANVSANATATGGEKDRKLGCEQRWCRGLPRSPSIVGRRHQSASGAAYAVAFGGLYASYASIGAFGVNESGRRRTGTTYGAFMPRAWRSARRIGLDQHLRLQRPDICRPSWVRASTARATATLRTKGYVGFEFAAADGLNTSVTSTCRSTVAGTGTASDTNYTSALTFYNASYQSDPEHADHHRRRSARAHVLGRPRLRRGGHVAGAAAYRRKKAA